MTADLWAEAVVEEIERLPEELARAMFCSDMDEEQTQFVLDHLVPEAWGPLLEPNRLARLRRGIPVSYIRLLSDHVVPPAQQDQMIDTIRGAMAEGKSAGVGGELEVEELESGHDAMVSRPRQLAEVLNRIFRRSH